MTFNATPSTISETTVAAFPGNPIAWQICRSASLRSSSISSCLYLRQQLVEFTLRYDLAIE